ncbi:hypothetical protein [Actinoplanes sp. NPDC020271]|uniref:hypothetical protein n=1 Tax=Actinoplanes sp. NPDC020271 TaxID=3363896 RepID=UPI00379F5C3F
MTQEERAAPGRFTHELRVGDRPALQRVLPFLTEESFDDRFEHGVTRLPAGP